MKFTETFSDLLWKAFLLFLPISSLTILSRFFGSTSVAPLSLIPMGLLLLIVCLPRIINSNFHFPLHIKPLYLFLLLAVFSTLLASFHNIPTFRDISWWRNSLEGFVTLAMGIGYYLVTITIIDSKEKLKTSIFWILLGGAVMMLYSLFQVGIWRFLGHYPQWMYRIQEIISASGRLFDKRASGFAYEPSWLAHQLNMVYLPILLALVFSGQTILKRKLFGKISIEIILLLLAMASLLVSFSRIGWITMIAMISFILFRLVNKLVNDIAKKRQSSSKNTKHMNLAVLKILLWMSVIVGMTGVLLLAGIILTKVDPRMAGLFDTERFKNFGLLGWASRLGIAERIVYWMAAYNVFEMYPFFGAGLGLAGFYFQTTVPEFGFRLPEINKVLISENFIPNAKNFWVRLLSETGIVGFSMFASWVVIHWRNAVELERNSQNKMLQTMGLAGKLIVISMIIEGFSLDSFGLPYVWVALGLLSATWLISQNPDEQSNLTAQTSDQ